MMIDEKKHMQELAARRIKIARKTDHCHPSSSGDIRTFIIPKLNLEATVHCVLVNWLDFSRLEPPITCKFKKNDIKEFIKTRSRLCQIVKNTIATSKVARPTVTDAARSVCGKESREGHIRTKTWSNTPQKVSGNI